MSLIKVLIIEDDPDIKAIIAYNLQLEGFRVSESTTGIDGLTLAVSEQPDVIVLDIMLPDFSGLEICKRLKGNSATSAIPVVMLTALSKDRDIIAGLEAGANDYVTKPFSPKVLIARINAQLRDKPVSHGRSHHVIKYDRLTIDLRKYSIKVNGTTVTLTPNEFKILTLLVSNPGWVFNRNEIIDSVRGEDAVVTDRTVDVQIFALRKKLGSYGKRIETIRGMGYRFRE